MDFNSYKLSFLISQQTLFFIALVYLYSGEIDFLEFYFTGGDLNKELTEKRLENIRIIIVGYLLRSKI